ncbi:MAG: Yip1 family protein [Acetivibrionales bacterium]|jgi:hypothetical protein
MENIEVNIASQDNAVKERSFIQKLFGVVFSPGDTMMSIVAKPSILFPILITAITPLVYILLRYDLYKEYLEYTMEISMANANVPMTPEQMDAAIRVGSVAGIAGAPIGGLIAWLIGSVAILILVKVFKGEGSFKQFLSISGYAYVITLIYYIISFAVSFASGNLYLDASLALLVPAMKGSLFYGVLRGIDFFSIWYYVVVGIGISYASKLSKKKVYLIVGIIYLITILINVNNAKLM